MTPARRHHRGARISCASRQRQAQGHEAREQPDDCQDERDRRLRRSSGAGLRIGHDIGRGWELDRELPAGELLDLAEASGLEVKDSSNGSPSTSPKSRNVYGPAAVGKKTDW